MSLSIIWQYTSGWALWTIIGKPENIIKSVMIPLDMDTLS